MANTLTNILPKILARGLVTLRERATMPRLVNSDYSAEAAKKGATIDVPIPTAVGTRDVTPSQVPPSASNTTPGLVQVPLNNWKQNDPIHLTDKEVAEIDRNVHFLPMQLAEAIKGLANDVNDDLLAEYLGVYGYYGTAGTTPFAAVTDAPQIRKILNKQLCPKEARRGVVDFDCEAAMLALAAFSDAEKIMSATVKIEGEIGRKYGIDWVAEDAIPLHTAGTITTGAIVKASTVHAIGVKTVVCTTAASTGAVALLEGDIILIAGDTQTYVLTADVTEAAASTDFSILIEPGLKIATAGSEAMTVKADHRVNLVFQRDAFAFAMRPLASQTLNPGGASQILTMQDQITGIVLRLEVSRQHKQIVWEFDILWGAKLVRAALAARLAG